MRAEVRTSGPGLGRLVLSNEAAKKDWLSGSFIKTAPDGQTQTTLVFLAVELAFHEYVPRE